MDKRPDRISVGSGETVGPRTYQVKRSPPEEPGRWLCWRYNENGSMGLVTWHLSKRRAKRVGLYFERTGKTRGFQC